jgi:feruloyl esterase
MLAQRFPKDYDGIIAGAPANNFVSLMTSFANYRSSLERLPPESLTPKIGLLHDAVLKKCDALDGVKDGIISDPRACRFDPGVLSCKPGQDSKTCLSAPELATVRTLYAGSRTSDGRLVHSGMPLGSEYLWPEWWTKAKSTGGAFAPYFFGYFVYDDTSWTMASFNLDRDWVTARRRLSPVLDATDTDIRPFVRAGGKLLMYQGWDDQAVSPYNTLAYYKAAARKLGSLSRGARLFMVPGMGHCFDGNGLTSADFLGEIDHWVESGKPPERIVAEKPVNWLLALANVPAKPIMTRPLCAYPKAARYIGKGSTSDEQNFVCR